MNKSWIIISVVLLVGISALFFINNASPASAPDNPQPSPTTIVEKPKSEDDTITPMQNPPTELLIEDLKVGTGTEAVSGKSVTVNYKGTLTDGTEFDSSFERNEPFTFDLGAGEVIQGWDKGVAGMKVGGKRKLTIPPSLGYGPIANGPIPANSTLIFEVELLGVE